MGARGKGYTPLRGAVEATLRVLYRGGWPAALWEKWPWACAVERAEHAISILPPGARPVRVGFVSDLHIGPTTPARLVDSAFGELARARLDVLLMGGDYVFLEATEEKGARLAELVSRVPATRKLAVLGNHDLWTRHAILERALERAGVEILTNASVRLGALGLPELAIVGLDDPWTGHVDARRAFERATGARAIVVLCHSPEGMPYAERALAAMGGQDTRPRALFACGHTHGGHIATPWGPLLVPGRLGKRYFAGLHALPAFHLHVSRGVGGIELPMRAFARPEVVVFELVSSPH